MVRGDRLDAAAVAAVAERTVRVDGDMADLAGHAMCSGDHPAVHDEPAADSRAHGHHGEVGQTHSGAEPLLGDGEGPYVVVDRRRQTRDRRGEFGERHVTPLQERRVTHHAVGTVHVAGEGDAQAHDVHAVAVRPGEQLPHDVRHRGQNRLGGTVGQRDVPREQEPAAQVGEHRVDGVAGEFESEEQGAAPVHPHQARGPAERRAGLRVGVLHQVSRLDEGPDRLRDGRRRQTGPPGQFQTGERAPGQQGGEDLRSRRGSGGEPLGGVRGEGRGHARNLGSLFSAVNERSRNSLNVCCEPADPCNTPMVQRY